MKYIYIVDVMDRTLEMVGTEIGHSHNNDTGWESQKELCRGEGAADMNATLSGDYRIVGIGRQSQNGASEGLEVIGQRPDV
jgi:hypothetical protein